MKILLIYPYCIDERPRDYDVRPVPIGVYYIAALLKEAGYDVEVLNWYNINKTPTKIAETLKVKRPAIIGFSIFNANRWGAIDIARVAKEIDPEVKVVFGGVGASFLWEHFLKHFPEVDYVVIGEGEYTFLNLVRALEKNGRGLEEIKGLAFRGDEGPIFTGWPDPIENIDSLPNPARYFTFQHVVSARGCPFNCTFCGSPRFWGRRVRFHSPGYFVDQLELLYQKGVNFFYVSDDTFTFQKKRVIEICQEIIRRGLSITWQAISRVDCIDEEILYWMRRAGCVQISYGVESGSEKIRRFFNKKISAEAIKRAFELTRRYGILPRAYFIYGSPGESQKTIQESIDLMLEIKPLSVVFYILDIYPGTALYEEFKRRTGATDDIWLKRIEDIMYHETDPDLPAEKVLAFGRRLKKEYYRHLPRFLREIDLVEKRDLYPHHADFLTRLAMTLRYGDYARNPQIRGKDSLAEHLFARALKYHPDHHAYLGLGIIYQQKRRFKESVKILEEGRGYFPSSEPLNICLGISYMNLGDYRRALECFLPFESSPEALSRAAVCFQALGDEARMKACLARLKALKGVSA
ncbi:radical SAM protein [Thermosulfuriphilus ammonigenes]|uniref:Radical SAM protein n=1 Tax=Thermosulfuriphilus ammonigenes TaxID=1936021 RepID=A0A6G7PTX6_9BACT|nr:radical SAM protein [Thermosulfuriphilus ammonigenes]MBA2848732.1 radical SAM superfamily enzyme YgiQ (UPF0313 family) [Thermosulfuriphilus ammonigenes]QIJ71135.1 radical SAM protein [Thermosulfuriphilus ammonigenes]